MRVEESRISKANICPYRGSEIPRWQELGLDPDRIYKLFRDPEELKKAAPSFEGKPLLIRHVPIDADLPHKDLWVGTIGSVSFDAPYLVSRPLMVLTKHAIELIESEEQRELSAAYRYDAIMEPGVYGGQQYDGRMANIRGNHVAIVSEGRAGPDVHVADELPTEFRSMKHSDLIRVLKPFLRDGVHPEMALDAVAKELGEVAPESVISLDSEEMKAAEDAARDEKRKAEGMDAELSDEEREEAHERARDRKAKDKKAKDKKANDKAAKDAKARDAKGKDEKDDDEKGEDEAHRDVGEVKGRDKKAKDGEVDHRKDFDPDRGEDSVTKDEMSAAVRAAVQAERERNKAAIQARELVKPLVGQVSIGMDSAEEIYRFALKQTGHKVDGVHASALPVIVEMAVNSKRTSAANPGAIAMDASSASLIDLDSLFPVATH